MASCATPIIHGRVWVSVWVYVGKCMWRMCGWVWVSGRSMYVCVGKCVGYVWVFVGKCVCGYVWVGVEKYVYVLYV